MAYLDELMGGVIPTLGRGSLVNMNGFGGLGEGLAQNRNALVGLGLGLMQPGGNPWGTAMAGYQAGARTDEGAQYRRALLAQHEADKRQAQANADRAFAEQKRQFDVGREVKPSIHWQTDMYGVSKPFLVNPNGSYRELSKENADQFSGQGIPVAPQQTSENEDTAIPGSAQYAQGGGAPQPPAGTNMPKWIESYSRKAGEERAKMDAKQQAAQTAAEQNISFPIVDRNIDKSIDLAKNGWFTTGVPGQISQYVWGTPSADLSNSLDVIAANISLDSLNKLRQESPTGGALGNVSDKDMALLKSRLGAIQQSQSKEQLVENLRLLKKDYYETIHGKGTYPGDRTDSLPVEAPPRAVQLLRGNPKLAPEFDAKYGQGASQRYLNSM